MYQYDTGYAPILNQSILYCLYYLGAEIQSLSKIHSMLNQIFNYDKQLRKPNLLTFTSSGIFDNHSFKYL